MPLQSLSVAEFAKNSDGPSLLGVFFAILTMDQTKSRRFRAPVGWPPGWVFPIGMPCRSLRKIVTDNIILEMGEF